MDREGARLHAATRPPFVETEAIRRAIAWAEATGGRLYIVHVSTGEGAERIGEARAGGVPVAGETCPQYLTLDESVFARPDGLRLLRIQTVIYSALAAGGALPVATDTCTFTRAQNDEWKGD
jgi:dihydropyrimidinase